MDLPKAGEGVLTAYEASQAPCFFEEFMAHSLVERYCQHMRELSARRKYAFQKALDFAVTHGLIKFRVRNTGSTATNANIEIIHCFGKYFNKWDAPETYTANSGRTYIFTT